MVILMRSLLFVPANSWRMLSRCLREDTDAVVLDLEDSVPIMDKETARWFIREFLNDLKEKPEYPKIIVRVNSWATGLTMEDLKFIVDKPLDAIMLPKSESSEDIHKLEQSLKNLEKERGLDIGSIKIIPLIETAKGVELSYDIALSSERVIALSFGAGDYMRDLGLSYMMLSKAQEELLYARSRIVVASRAAGIIPIDTPYLGLIIDREGLEHECIIAKKLGFKGKLAIHPSHLPIINKTFSPSENEVREASEIVKTFEEAASRGMGAATYAGRMIDYMTYKQAKDIIEQAMILKKRYST